MEPWDIFKNTIKWMFLAAIVGWGCVWAFGKLSHMGETSPSKNGEIRDAREIMKPPSRNNRGW